MGYTTYFAGSIELSRELTFVEARQLLEIAEDSDKVFAESGIKAYLQWVPAETLQHIVWDQQEKFYEYIPMLKWLCGWLRERHIIANGRLSWSGADAGDSGQIIVTDNEVVARPNEASKNFRPLTLSRLKKAEESICLHCGHERES